MSSVQRKPADFPENDLQSVLNEFAGISLAETERARLMKRTDTKFLISREMLPFLLAQIQESYAVLEIENCRQMSYNSRYFDTENKDFYRDHHNGKARRMKIRIRKYAISETSFLEIKQKDTKGNTDKNRILLPNFESELSDFSREFVRETGKENRPLFPVLENSFERISFTHLTENERFTVDTDIYFQFAGRQKIYDKPAIIELKQEGFNRNSSLALALKKMGCRPAGISKYCLGMLALHPGLKHNLFKSKLLKINKITN